MDSQMSQNLNEIESTITNDKLISQLVNDVTQIPTTNDKLISQMINDISDTPKEVANTNDKFISQMINDVSDTPAIRDISNNENKNEPEAKKSKKQKEDSGDKDFVTRPCQLPLSRLKTIMKLDPELNLTSKDSVFLVAKATVCIYFKLYSLC